MILWSVELLIDYIHMQTTFLTTYLKFFPIHTKICLWAAMCNHPTKFNATFIRGSIGGWWYNVSSWADLIISTVGVGTSQRVMCLRVSTASKCWSARVHPVCPACLITLWGFHCLWEQNNNIKNGVIYTNNRWLLQIHWINPPLHWPTLTISVNPDSIENLNAPLTQS